jgi:hypothetical protein
LKSIDSLANPMMKDLGSITQVGLRDVWATEPEFTRWLSEKEHLAALGEELGIDLALLETEADVGDFSADILAIEAASNDKVIIENQFGTTNHDHLGKIIGTSRNSVKSRRENRASILVN